ncbi:uncharacterized protein [Neodiprion pinetum]|uniref:uncharacterized protein n=1 Tax=Neodiprion pinetum TaxID=441929 RepID=UPI003711240F
MLRYLISVTLILAIGDLHQVYAARILGIFPMPSLSHQVVFRGLTLALRERGHELVVVTPNPINDPTLKNYTEVDVSFLYDIFNKETDWIAGRNEDTWLGVLRRITPIFMMMTEGALGHSEVQKLHAPNSGEKFDLMLIEMLYWPAYLPLAKRFDVPVVGMASLSLSVYMQYGIGNPIMASHPSNWDCGAAVLGDLTFWQRLKNFVRTWRFLYWYRTDYMQKQQEIARKYFGNDIPDIGDVEKNISLVFVNQQTPITFVRPNIPNIVGIGGFHVSNQSEPLSKDLQRTLDEATQGFIYMSLGSNVKSATLSKETRGEFIAAFSKLPYIVIWKFENDFLPDKPDNVFTVKWAPQQSILAHPNIKAFIYQGGLQSTEEAVSYAVPVIGLPVFADQDTQVDKMVSLGVGKQLEILTVNRVNLVETIESVVTDSSYKERMLKLRDLMEDKPYDSLENAVWWTEHVIRHKGAPHLHSTTADDPWYQQQDMDLIFIISSVISIALITALVVLYKVLVHSVRLLNRNHLPFDQKDKRHLITVILVVIICQQGFASRILGVFPATSISHQFVYRQLTLALRERGHELVVITPDPINDPTLKNYTEIDVHSLYEEANKIVNCVLPPNKTTWLEKVQDLAEKFMLMSQRILSHSVVKKVYAPNSGEKFDLLIIEMLFWQALLPLAKRFDVPVIGISSFGLSLHLQHRIGNPVMPSHPVHWDAEIKVLGKLSLWQRLWNLVYAWRLVHFIETDCLPRQQMIARKYFGNDIPDIADMEKNISLVFVNQQAPISFVSPNVPKIINIGGFHVSKHIETLSQDLQKTLDEATHGFIYMSLGTNFKSTMLSNKTRGEFLAAFSQLPYIVIWKFEDILPGRPDNVITMKWAPQQTILAHPNIKAFIYQGGLQSTEEAVSYAVPVIGLPTLGDQYTHVNKMVSLGVGKKLEILTFNRMDLVEAIRSVTTDVNYKQRMLKLRDLMEDKPYDSLKNAVWWTEHVIRHKGAPHLHSTTADDPWYQRQDMDLIFIISTVIWIAFSITLFVLYKLLVYSINCSKDNRRLMSKKKRA